MRENRLGMTDSCPTYCGCAFAIPTTPTTLKTRKTRTVFPIVYHLFCLQVVVESLMRSKSRNAHLANSTACQASQLYLLIDVE